MTNYYNEIDKDAAEWLRALISAGHIAPGDVDTRSIEDVRPDELVGYTQCHFFAGLGLWSLALRRAGWPDDRPVWTGSCPCQPFSAAGKGAGFDDERHVWPAFHHLISQRSPAIVFGEQVASKDAEPWLDLVQDDLEALGYAFGAVPFPSAGIGAPHIRDRLYWVADTSSFRHDWRSATSQSKKRAGTGSAVSCSIDGLDNTNITRPQGHPGHDGAAGWQGQAGPVAEAGISGGTGPTNGHWADADWLHCRDGKWRPVEPGTFPLAHGLPVSMGKLSPELRAVAEMAELDGESLKRAKQYRIGGLRGYGNAINVMAAEAFIRAAA